MMSNNSVHATIAAAAAAAASTTAVSATAAAAVAASNMAGTVCPSCNNTVEDSVDDVYIGAGNERWHRACRLIFQYWGAHIFDPVTAATSNTSFKSASSPHHRRRPSAAPAPIRVETINAIYQSFSAFEQAVANCILETVVDTSVRAAERLVLHIESLFAASDALDTILQKAAGSSSAALTAATIIATTPTATTPTMTAADLLREPRRLVKRVVALLAVLSNLAASNSAGAASDDIGRDLVSHVAVISHCTKTVLQRLLTTAIRIDTLYCCSEDGASVATVREMSQLEQYVFLLRVALVRFSDLLSADVTNRSKTAVQNVADDMRSATPIKQSSQPSSPLSVHVGRTQSYQSQQSHLQHLSQQHHRQQSHSPAPFARSPIPGFTSPLASQSVHSSSSISRLQQQQQPSHIPQVSVVSGKDRLSSFVAGGSTESLDIGRDGSPSTTAAVGSLHDPVKRLYLSDLQPHELHVARFVSILRLQSRLNGAFTMDEMLAMAGHRKQSFWQRLKWPSNRSNSSQQQHNLQQLQPSTSLTASGPTFGVALDVLMERQCVEAETPSLLWQLASSRLQPSQVKLLGIPQRTLRIPMFFDRCLVSLLRSDLATEGIFRKNGNARKLAELVQNTDQDLQRSVNELLPKESSIMIAALLKRFLRSLPEPIFTTRLFKLLCSCSSTSEVEVMQLAFHLLPPVNRDMLEILVAVLRYTATFAVDESSPSGGSKMDLSNIATVFAMNMLSSTPTGDSVTPGSATNPAAVLSAVSSSSNISSAAGSPASAHSEALAAVSCMSFILESCGGSQLFKTHQSVLDVLKSDPMFVESIRTQMASAVPPVSPGLPPISSSMPISATNSNNNSPTETLTTKDILKRCEQLLNNNTSSKRHHQP
ncbi:RhoGAP-domain-containing protein [Ramicandelaber brevisporus]|nr:RhoGAP-domain-containing protein [Ramicandelaber brevisporus]